MRRREFIAALGGAAAGALAGRAMRTLNIDAGSMRARRIIDDMIESEMRTATA
jgi:hypothetical protein